MGQMRYMKEVLKHFNIEECKPVGTSFDVNSKLLKLLDEEFGNVQGELQGIPYNVGVEIFMYAIMGTNIDLTFVVSIMRNL
jgi:hypothetical protein